MVTDNLVKTRMVYGDLSSTDIIHYIYFPILILEKEPVFPLLLFIAKQGNYWYHFITSLVWCGPWLGSDLLHSKPALYHQAIEEAVCSQIKKIRVFVAKPELVISCHPNERQSAVLGDFVKSTLCVQNGGVQQPFQSSWLFSSTFVLLLSILFIVNA